MKDKAKAQSFDSVVSNLEFSVSNKDQGLASTQFYKSKDYRDLMQSINQIVPLEGALKCSIYLSSYFNMPLTNQQDIEAANKTLNIAFDCLIGEGVPFYK